MGQISSNISAALNGSSNIVVGNETYSWGAGRHISMIEVDASLSTTARTATFTLSGSDWGISVLRFAKGTKAVINDSNSGDDRYIEYVTFSNAGGNTATFNKTHIGLIKGSAGADKITVGSTFVGVMHLGEGHDTVTTGNGIVETINAGNGNNIITVGNGGAGMIVAGQGRDTITVSGDVDSILAGHGNDAIKTGKGWVGTIDADRGNDIVTLGNGGAGYISLGRDSDTIILNRLSDKTTIVFVDGGSGVSSSAHTNADTIDFAAFSSNLTVDLNGSYTVKSGYGDFLIRNFENAIGGKGSDTLIGDVGSNILAGGNGNDRIEGGIGADKLYGGAGADTFIFKSIKDSTVAVSGRDTIYDFNRAQKDKIDLSAIDANTKLSGNQSFDFIGTKAFSKKAGELRHEKKSGDTFVYGDINGDGKSDFSLLLDLSLTMSKADFIL